MSRQIRQRHIHRELKKDWLRVHPTQRMDIITQRTALPDRQVPVWAPDDFGKTSLGFVKLDGLPHYPFGIPRPDVILLRSSINFGLRIKRRPPLIPTHGARDVNAK